MQFTEFAWLEGTVFQNKYVFGTFLFMRTCRLLILTYPFPRKTISWQLTDSGNIFYLAQACATVEPRLSTTATLGTEESGHCREVAIVERLKFR